MAAVLAAASRCPVDTVVDTDIPQARRFSDDVEAVAYFVGVRIEDDGRGGAHVGKGHGLAGLDARVGAAGGRLAVDSPDGGPTMLTALVPRRADGAP